MKNIAPIAVLSCVLTGLPAHAADEEPLVLPPELGILTETIDRETRERVFTESVTTLDPIGHEIRGVPGNYKMRLKVPGLFNDIHFSSGVLDQLGCVRHAMERGLVKRLKIHKTDLSRGHVDANRLVIQFKDGITLKASDVDRLCYIANQGDHRTQVIVLDGPEGGETPSRNGRH